jgi:hypothetical protein
MDDSQLEELREENHRLNLRLEHLKQTSTSELDYLREELALKDREHKEQLEKLGQDAKSREAELQERVSMDGSQLQIKCLRLRVGPKVLARPKCAAGDLKKNVAMLVSVICQSCVDWWITDKHSE